MSAAKFVLTSFLLAIAFSAGTAVQAKGVPPTETARATVALSELPLQGRETYALIRAGGKFPYEKDGTVFGNRERLLPKQPRGYYLEYTVRTTGSRNRGARRIVCGGPPRAPNACYYTADHYASFRRIEE
jgi:ribonuclease T1